MFWSSHPVLLALLACVVIQFLAWFRQKQTSNADTVDIAWTLGIIVCAVIYLLLIPTAGNNIVMTLLFPILWYFRLLFHLVVRYDVKHEDSRYQNLRAHWSDQTQLKFFSFFMFQAVLSVLFSLTAYWVITTAVLSVWQMLVAGFFGGLSLIGVSVADHQLLRFKRNHDSSQVCNVGLWRYSRHPNYFFEWLHWFVYPVLLWGTEYFWWSWLVVAMMLLFLLKLTGIPFSEQQALKKRGQAYRDYMKQTSQFILWRKNND
jgi:steroid 5-alpha reductase family enzyme